MRKFATSLIIAALSVVAVSARDKAADYKLNVQNFCELTVVDGVGVDYVCLPDSAGWAVFSCPPDMAAHIMFENKAEHLTVKTDADESPIRGIPRVRLYSASLRKVTNSGDSLLRLSTSVPVSDFSIHIIGNGVVRASNVRADNVDVRISAGCGHVYIDGTARRCTARNVGTGLIEASRLRCEEFSCFVVGPGNIHCRPSAMLKVYGAGSGIVYYHTTPAAIKKRGLGVKARPDSEAPKHDRLLTMLPLDN